MPPDRADGTDGLRWTVRRTQKTHRVEILQPLTIAHVGLTARHILYVASVHQTHSETVILQNLKQRNPEHSRGKEMSGTETRQPILPPTRGSRCKGRARPARQRRP